MYVLGPRAGTRCTCTSSAPSTSFCVHSVPARPADAYMQCPLDPLRRTCSARSANWLGEEQGRVAELVPAVVLGDGRVVGRLGQGRSGDRLDQEQVGGLGVVPSG